MDPSAPADGQPSPTSLPGRDPVADADTTLIRKRQRTTPPQRDVEGLDSPGHPTGSPLVIEVIALEQDLESPAEIIIMDDEIFDANDIASFPWAADHQGPEQAAAHFANICCGDTSIRNSFNEELTEFASWLQDHVAASSNARDQRTYVQNRTFWFHVGRCFEGLATRSMDLPSWKEPSGPAFYLNFLVNFAKLFAMLCEVEADQLEHATSRRDSAKPASPTKHCLLFRSYITSFEVFMARSEDASNITEHDPFFAIQQRMALAFLRQQKERDSLFRTFSLVAARAEAVEFAQEALLSCLRISARVFATISSEDPAASQHGPASQNMALDHVDYIEELRTSMVNMLELYTTRIMPNVMKTHPEYLPTNFHNAAVDTLGCVIDVLAPSYLPPGLVAAMERTMGYHIALEDLVAPRNNSPTADPAFTKQTLSVAFRLETYNLFIRSGMVTLRVIGLEMLGHFVFHLWRSLAPDPRKVLSPDSRAQSIHPTLQFTAKFLLSNDFVRYLFGSDSHADLIRRSPKVVDFLAATNNLRSSDADVLWNTCLHNQLTDVGQASFQALASLFRTNSLPELMYFCKKYEDLSPSHLGKPMISVFKELLMNIQSKSKKPSPEECFEVAAIAARLLQRISSVWKDVDIQNFRCLASPSVIDLLELSGNGSEYRLMILKLCAAEIKARTSHATGSAHMLHDLVFSHPTDMPKPELTDVLTFKAITDELCQYVNCQKADGEASGTSGAFALFSRLRLANLMLAWMPNTCEADAERKLWEHTIGVEAIDNEARTLAWHALIMDLKILPSLSSYLERCVGSYLPTLPASHAVTDLIVAYRYAQETAPVDRRFDLAFGNEIIRFALTIPEGDIADVFMQHAMEALFSRKALSVPDAAADQQVAVVERCIECIRSQTGHQPLRAVKLLRKLLQQSIAFQSTIAAPEVDPLVGFKPGNDEESMVRFSVDIYGTPGREARRSIIIGRHETLAELQSALVKTADFNDILVICGGQPLDVSKHSLKKIDDSGIVGKALIVKKNNTLQTIEDDRSRKSGRSALERAILQNFSELYSRLDDADETSEQIFWLLTELQHSTAWHAIPLDGNPWKLLFSVHRLSVELREQLAFGIADSSFILQGVHKMILALEEPQFCSDRLVLRYMARTLFEFLRERPLHDLSNHYFTDASKFVHAALSTLCTVAQMAEHPERIDEVDISDPSQTALDLYRSVLEGVRISPVVCKAFVEAPIVTSVHKKILFHGNQALSGGISHCIGTFCVDQDSPAEAQSLFWTTILDFVPEAQNDPTTCASLYRMAPEILRTNATVTSSETELKNLVDRFSAILLQTDHQERFGTNLIDHRVSGLCSLLLVCIDKLKSFKKPLNLGHFAIQVFQLFLFPPPVHGLDSKYLTMPIVTGETRRSLYCLVYALCEDQSTLTALTNLTLQALRLSDIPSWLSFPGREGFSRANCGYSGLTNLQQTCYMNSLLQQLYMNLKFRKFILDTPVVNDTRQAVLQEFKHAFASMQDSYSLAYTPDNLARALDVDITVQDDAQIFFTILIGKLEDSMPNEDAKKSLRAFFGGSNRSQTVGECGHVSESPDSYYNLSLVVKDKSTLEESLQEYVQGAPLEGGDKFKCVTCDAKGGGVYVNATRRTGLEHVPDNLVLGLKRFRYETYDGGAKVNDRFDFPERIDMNPYKLQCITNPGKPMDSDIFQLVGVVVHDGTLQYGHYWSYAAERSVSGPESMPWYRFEDRLANRVTVEDVISETRGGLGRPDRSGQAWTRSDNAYVLFYERLSSIKSSAMQESSSLGPTMGLHPTVAIPEDLRNEITMENEKHLRKLNVFAVEHADFVRGLLMKFEDISKGQPTEDKAAELSLLELTFEHLFQVTTRTPALDHLDVIASSMRKLTSLSPDNAVHLIRLMFHQSHPETCEHLIFHRRSAVRNHIRHVLVAALRSLREQDPGRYGIEADGRLSEHVDTSIGLVTRAHSVLLSRLHHTATRTGWPEYFAFVTDIASFGQAEVNLLLDRGYLTWCLEILYIGHDKTLQAKHADMWYHMENNRVYPRHALSDCIYGLVHEYVDLSKVSEAVTDEYQASITPDRTFLNREEIALFTRTDRKGHSALVASVLDSVKDDEELLIRPARLVTLLTDDSKTDKLLVKAACLALQHGLEDDGFPVYVEAISHCLSNVKVAPGCRNMLIEAVAKLPEHYEDVAETVLRFMKSVYAVAPIQVLGLVTTWLEKLLVCEDTESEDAALEWLRTQLFSYTPLTKPYDYETLTLDYHHSVTVRQLAGFLMQICAHGRNQSADFQEYERVVEALRGCVPWLEGFDDTMRKQYSTDEQDIGADSGETQMDARVIARIEDLKEAAMDARDLWQPIQETFRCLNDWSEGEATGMAFTHRYRSLGASYSRTNDADTDGDLAATEDEEDWDSDGGDEPDLP